MEMNGSTESKLHEQTSFTFMLIIIILIGLSSFFKPYLYSFGKLLLDEDFGYLSVALVSVFLTLYFSLRHSGFSFGISALRVLIGLYLLLLSLIFYFSAGVDPDHMVQYYGLSFVFLFLGLWIVVFTPVYARDLVPLLSLFLLVPSPASWVDMFTPWLSRVVGGFVAWLSGSSLSGAPGYSVLVVNTNWGVVRFQVEYACTGIVTMSSILVVLPVLLYLLAYSPRSWFRKLLASVAALGVAVMLGFIGNIIRVLLVVYGSKWFGPETGLELFHYSPSIIYATLSLLVGFYVADRIGGIRLALPRLHVGRMFNRPEAVAGVLVILLIFTGFFVGVVESTGFLSGGNSGFSGPGLIINAPSPGDYIRNPGRYLGEYAGNISFTGLIRDEQLTRILNAFVVYRVYLKYLNYSYTGYLEIVDTPGRLHTWQLCLTLQGYNVYDSYTKSVNGSTVYFIDMRRGGRGYLLGYVLLPTRIVSGTGRVDLYTRISLISPYTVGEKEAVEDRVSHLLASIRGAGTMASSGFIVKYVDYLSLTSYLLLFIVAGYGVYSRLVLGEGAVRSGFRRG